MGLTVTAMGSEKKLDVRELKKHAASIHCSNSLSLLQRKISNALLYHAYKELLTQEEHEISIKQLCNLIAYSGNNHSAIKDALKGLLSTVIEWNVVSDTTGIEDWTASSILASVSLRGPTCLYAYSPRMKQLLHSPTMFGKINLFVQSRFKSSYGLALYENCIRYRGLPFTKWLDMETFRKLMGVPDDKYTIFRDFKKRVLDKSVEEVNTYADLFVEPELAKEGRQVSRIRFVLKERPKKNRLGQPANHSDATEPNDVRNKLLNQFYLAEEQIEQILRDYNHEFILEKMAIVEESKNYQQGKVQNIAGYFLSALKNNYQPPKAIISQNVFKARQETEEQFALRERRKLVMQVQEAYANYREETIDAAIESLLRDEKQNFMTAFYQDAAESIKTVLRLQGNKYTQATVIHSPQIKALMRQFALQFLPTLAHTIVPMEQFIERLPESQRVVWKESETFETQSSQQQVALLD
jgi:hypothetical protein